MAALNLDDQRRGGIGLGHSAQHVGKQRRVVIAARQRHGGELRPGGIVDKALAGGHAVQRIIVENHQLMVRRKLYVQFNAVAVAGRGGKSGQAVFRRALVLAEVAAVGIVAAIERGPQVLALSAGPDGKQHQRSQNHQYY